MIEIITNLNYYYFFASQFRLGGMLYDPKEDRDIKRSFLPAPRDVEFTLDALYEDIIRQGQEVFFQDFADENAMYYLADSYGACIDSFRPGMTIRQYVYVSGTLPEPESLVPT